MSALVVLGTDGRRFGTEATLGFVQTFEAAPIPGPVALAWTAASAVVAVRLLPWEPRA